MTIVGARPQFIKAAPLCRALSRKHRSILVHTGQHYDRSLSQQFFDQMGIPRPDYNLEVGSSGHGQQTGQMLQRLEPVMQRVRPHLVVVLGDTNSTLAGALAASKLHIPLAHIEAGMRSFNRNMPEEINRVVADHLSDISFCSTDTAVENLKREGITRRVYLVGDIMVDALKNFLPRPQDIDRLLSKYSLPPEGYLLATIHRAENTDDRRRLAEIVSAFLGSPWPVVFPAHPRTLKMLGRFRLLKPIQAGRQVRIISPLGYVESLALQSRARAVVTDSGGIQKEAYILGTPCLTIRQETEWVETLNTGWNRLVPADRKKILSAIGRIRKPRAHPRLYGDGRTAQRIAGILGRLLRA